MLVATCFALCRTSGAIGPGTALKENSGVRSRVGALVCYSKWRVSFCPCAAPRSHRLPRARALPSQALLIFAVKLQEIETHYSSVLSKTVR